MFERFTDRSRRIVALAPVSARQFNHNYIGTEHLLHAILMEGECVAAQALSKFDMSVDGVSDQITTIIGQGQQAPSGHIPFTPRAKKVLELSLREALQLGHNYIGTEHILLGLIREGEGVGAQIICSTPTMVREVRVRGDKPWFDLLRDQVLELIGQPRVTEKTNLGYGHEVGDEMSALGAYEAREHETNQRLADLHAQAVVLAAGAGKVLALASELREELSKMLPAPPSESAEVGDDD